MRPMNTVNPKAGTLKQMSSSLKNTLHNTISKFASMMLVIAVAFSVMSFDQGDSAGNFDTNYAGRKDKANEIVKAIPDSCCVVGKQIIPVVRKNVSLRMPDRKSLVNADYETMRHFIVSVKEALVRQMWAVPAVELVKTSDDAINANFDADHGTDVMTPSTSDLAKADEDMDIEFARSQASHLSNPAIKYVAVADEEMTENFEIENFKMSNPSTELVAKADADMSADFEVTNNPKISMPTADLIASADQGMSNFSHTTKKVISKKSVKGAVATNK